MLPEPKQEAGMTSTEAAQASPGGDSPANQEGVVPVRSGTPTGPPACMPPVPTSQQQLDANRLVLCHASA